MIGIARRKSFSALQVALMFTLYELAGVVTNLAAGLAGARWGIQRTLVTGLCLQLVSYGMLFGWRDEWSQAEAIAFVSVAQMFGGIAKDLTKLGGKTVTKLVTPSEQSTRLFRLVSLLTGWKNSLKGVGYFLGSALIAVRYELALGCMMALVAIALPFAIFGLDRGLGTAKKKNSSLRDILDTNNPNLNYLSLARLFLFASRDFWFEVPLPFFLRSPPCAGLGAAACAADGDCAGGARARSTTPPSARSTRSPGAARRRAAACASTSTRAAAAAASAGTASSSARSSARTLSCTARCRAGRRSS